VEILTNVLEHAICEHIKCVQGHLMLGIGMLGIGSGYFSKHQSENQALCIRSGSPFGAAPCSLTLWLAVEAMNRPPHKTICVKSFARISKKTRSG
jgi:hypothetical protein